MNILIIGGAGGIGSELLNDLTSDTSNNIIVGYHKKKPDINFESYSLDASKFNKITGYQPKNWYELIKEMYEFNLLDK